MGQDMTGIYTTNNLLVNTVKRELYLEYQKKGNLLKKSLEISIYDLSEKLSYSVEDILLAMFELYNENIIDFKITNISKDLDSHLLKIFKKLLENYLKDSISDIYINNLKYIFDNEKYFEDIIKRVTKLLLCDKILKSRKYLSNDILIKALIVDLNNIINKIKSINNIEFEKIDRNKLKELIISCAGEENDK